jgi:hypothetical protein
MLANVSDIMHVLADVNEHMELSIIDVTDSSNPQIISSLCSHDYGRCTPNILTSDMRSSAMLIANQWINRKYV